ncbi:hypothetical protein CHUAL_004925 [Chamberlinius hualienensis]
MAASSGDKTVNKVALCSAIFAGFAYVGYSVVRNAICRRGLRSSDDDGTNPRTYLHVVVGNSTATYSLGPQTDESRSIFDGGIRRFSVASQTDFLLGNLDISNGGIFRPLSVQERIRQLNFQARHLGDQGLIMKFSPFYKPRSLQCSPWNSPRILSPVDINQFISRSAENLTSVSTPPSPPGFRRKSSTRRSTSRPASANHNQEETTQVTEVHILLKDSEETLKKRLEGLYNKGRVVTPYEAQSLVTLLYTRDDELLLRAITTITNCAAFSVNQNYFREAGGLHMLTDLMTNSTSKAIQTAAIQAIGNLSLNQENIKELKNSLTPLLNNLEKRNTENDDLVLPSLITLTNLAVCKLLVNLSCNSEMVPHLLAGQAPSSLMNMLDPNTDEEFILRLTTVMDNLTYTVEQMKLDPSQLPAEKKAPSPETLYAAIYSLNVVDKMKTKLALLMEHSNDEVRHHAQQIFNRLKG